MIACASYELSITDFGCLHSEAVVWRCSVKKVFLEIFLKFTGEHLYQRLFFNKGATSFYRAPLVAASVL